MSAEYEDRFVQVGDARARYWQAGEGPAVLLLGGIGCSVTDWENNIGALAQRHRVYALDMLGEGLTDKPAGDRYALADLARFALDFLEKMGEPRAHLIGHSLGGRLTLECVRIAPDRVQSMVLVAPAGVGMDTHLMMRLPTIPWLGELLTRPNRAGIAQLWRLGVHDPAFVTEELVETKYRLASAPGAQTAFLKTLRGFVAPGGFRRPIVEALQRDLPAMRQPALVIWGKQDRLLPCAQAEILRTRLPDAKLLLFDACGHLPQGERVEGFNKAVLSFLADRT
jgi:pimeloyl-ACP methyl ester carboxylesterase